MLSRIFSEPLTSVSNKHNYKTFSESPPAFPPYFLIIWRGKRPFLINRTRTFAWKEPLPITPPLPLGKFDNNLSLRVGDFAQKNHPRPKLPGGGPSGIHLILPLLRGVRKQTLIAKGPIATKMSLAQFFTFPLS